MQIALHEKDALRATPGWTDMSTASGARCYMPLAHRAEAAAALVMGAPEALGREMARQLIALRPRGKIVFVGAGDGQLEALLLALAAEQLEHDVEAIVVEPAATAAAASADLWRHYPSVELARDAGYAGDDVTAVVIWPPPPRAGEAVRTPSLIGLALEVLEPASMLIVSAPCGMAGVPEDALHLYRDDERLRLLTALVEPPAPPPRRLCEELALVQSTVYVACEQSPAAASVFTTEVSTWSRTPEAAASAAPRRRGHVLYTSLLSARPTDRYVVGATFAELGM